MQREPDTDVRTRSCETCRFWWLEKTRRGGLGWGQCRRMPPALPAVRADKLKLVGIWPETEADDWCGEWQDRREDVADQA